MWPTAAYGGLVTFTRQRQEYFDALDWVRRLIASTALDQLDPPAPEVRRLLVDLVAAAARALEVARGTPTRETPPVVTEQVVTADGDLTRAFTDIAESLRQAWSRLDAADTVVTPQGRRTALDAVRGLTRELVVRGWDLAVATGQVGGAPDDRPDVAAIPGGFLVTVEGHDFLVREREGEPGVSDFEWLTGPADYGFTSAGSGRSPITRSEAEEAIRNFLAQVDPATGYIG